MDAMGAVEERPRTSEEASRADRFHDGARRQDAQGTLHEIQEHHVEEEEGEMFKLARRALDEEELTALGKRMDAKKKELEASA
jgi:hypothetical protein